MKVYAFIADGSEEVECLCVVDLLKRAKIDVELVSIHDRREIKSLHDITIVCDSTINDIDIDDADVLFVPGGVLGVKNMKESDKLKELLEKHNEKNKRLASICAGPSVLGEFGLLDDKRATVYPGFQGSLKHYEDKGMINDGNVVTAKSLAYAFDLGFELIRLLTDEDRVKDVKDQIKYPN